MEDADTQQPWGVPTKNAHFGVEIGGKPHHFLETP